MYTEIGIASKQRTRNWGAGHPASVQCSSDRIVRDTVVCLLFHLKEPPLVGKAFDLQTVAASVNTDPQKIALVCF